MKVQSDPELESRLVHIDPMVLERGDFVYERVAYGTGEAHFRYTSLKVVKVERGVVVCTGTKTGETKQRKVRFNELRMEAREVPKVIKPPKIVNKLDLRLVNLERSEDDGRHVAETDAGAAVLRVEAPSDEIQTWLDMGRMLIEAESRKVATLEQQRTDTLTSLAASERNYSSAIDELKQELRELEETREAAKAEKLAEVDAIDRKLKADRERLADLSHAIERGSR